MKELSFTPKSLSAITVAGTLTSESLQVMKKKSLLFLVILLIPFLAISQNDSEVIPEEVLAMIAANDRSDLPEDEKLVVADSLYNLLMIHYEYLSYETKLRLAQKTMDYEQRIFLYKKIRSFRFYLVRHPYYSYKFKIIYVKSTNYLIDEYQSKKDLHSLYNLNIVPAVYTVVYAKLKRAIEASGGCWDREELIYEEIPGKGVRGNRN